MITGGYDANGLPKMHVLDRRAKLLADRMDGASIGLAQGIAPGPNQAPPFHVKLSDDEQLEIYFAMDSPKWASFIQTYGLHTADEYSLDMQKKVQERWPDNQPQWVAYQAGTHPDLTDPTGGVPNNVQQGQARMGMLNPQLNAGKVHTPDEYLGQALASAGVRSDQIQALIQGAGQQNQGGAAPPSPQNPPQGQMMPQAPALGAPQVM